MKDDLKFDFSIDRKDKVKLNGHQPLVIWFYGLSGSGKSTISNYLQIKLHEKKINTVILDGDTIRQGLNKDLKFSTKDRLENIRRIAEISKILYQNGMVVLCSFITPLNVYRDLAEKIIGKENIFWVYVNTSIDICIDRDPKGLYRKALKKDIKNFTGISQKFEKPFHKFFEIVNSNENDILKLYKQILKKLLK